MQEDAGLVVVFSSVVEFGVQKERQWEAYYDEKTRSSR
jgi:hypothetical protein